MICDKCGNKMKSTGTVDEYWRFYRCKCGYEAAKHIHPKDRSRHKVAND